MYNNGYATTKIYELYKDRTKEFAYVSMGEVMMNAIINRPSERDLFESSPLGKHYVDIRGYVSCFCS